MGTDAWPGRPGWNQMLAFIDNLAAQGLTGTTPARPAPGITSRFYFATDTQRIYFDTGSAWVEISPVGGGGPPAPNAPTASEGTSRIAARSDHVHQTRMFSGTLVSRPAAGVQDRYFWATDVANMYHDDGSQWIEVAPIGGGGVPPVDDPSATGTEGVSAIAARADHQHPGYGTFIATGAAAAGVASSAWSGGGSLDTVLRSDGPASQLSLYGLSGVRCAIPGWYHVEAQATFTGSGSGRRLIGVDTSGGGSGPTQVRWDYPGGTSSTQVINAVGEVNTHPYPGATISMYVYQDSGGPLNVTNRQLLVRRTQ